MHGTCGQLIDTPNESEISAVVELKSGVCGTAHVNNDSVLEDQHFFAIYGTDGRRSSTLRRGINIVRQSDNTVKKVIVR